MKFSYRARTKEGEMKSGEIEASSKDVAAVLLHKYGLFPTYLEQVKPPFLERFKIQKKISKKDLSVFSSQLGVMLESRVSPTEALLAIASQTPNEVFKKNIIELSEIIERGSSFSEALSFFPKIFDNFYISIIRAGESTGRLAESLRKLAVHLGREYDIQNRIRGALVYPALVFCVAVIVVLIVVFGVIPTLANIVGDISKLSFMARFMFGLSDFIKKWGIFVLVMIFGIILFFIYYFRTPRGKESWDKISIKLPFLGDFFKKTYLARLAEGLSTLISAGISINQALRITADVVNNLVYRQIILEAEAQVKRGENLNISFARWPEFISPFFVQMIKTGEATGKLDQTLLEVVDFYQKEIDVATRTFMTIIEPILIIVVGAVVAFVGAAIFSAIYGAMKALY